MSQAPDGSSLWLLFGLVTLPSVIFSPFAEEFLYRGFIQSHLTKQYSVKLALNVQAILFAVVHLSHYGLIPFQPLLILIFLPSMYATALLFGWLVVKSDSIWTAVISHTAFNFGMNGIVFLFYQDLLSV
jgi:membrane protease YdiL (CAAX protease family)